MATLRVAHGDDADPEPVATSATPRSSTARAGSRRCRSASRSSCCRRRCRCGSASSSSTASSTRATCSSRTTRTTAAATSPTSTCSRRCSRPTASCCSSRRSSATTATPAARSRAATTSSPRTSGRRARATRCSRSSRRARSGATSCSRCARTTGSPGFIGDLRAQVGAAQLGARRLGEIVADVRCRRGARPRSTGRSRTRTAGSREEIAALARRHVRGRRVRRLRSRRQPDIHVHVAITVDGDKLIVDFAGSDDRPEINAWSTFGNTRGYTIAQLASLVDPSIPKNEGFFDCIDLRVPEGTLREPGRRASRSARAPTIPASRSATRSRSRWRRSSPTAARRRPTSTAARARCGATRPAHRASRSSTTAARSNAGWVNAVQDVDGWGALVAANGNLIKASAEINEALFPHILRGRNYLTDSGGAGQWRGGCGSHFVKEVRTPTRVNQYVVNQRHLHPGIAGGHDGCARSLRARAGHRPRGRRRPDGGRASRSRPASSSSTTSAAAAGGATRSSAIRRRCSTTSGTSTCRSTARADDYGVVITGSLEDMTLALDAGRHRARCAREPPVRAMTAQ